MSLATAGTLFADVSPERMRQVCGQTPSDVCRWVLNQTDNVLLAHFADNIVGPLVRIVLIWVVALLASRVARVVIKRVGRQIEGATDSGRIDKIRHKTPGMLLNTGRVGMRSAARAQTTTGVLRSLSSVVIYSIATFYSIAALGVSVGPLIASAGIAGIALGFGTQSMVRDFIGGMFMLIEDQFGVGDFVEVAAAVDGSPGVVGVVENVTMRITDVRDVQGTIWHIPNGEIRRVGNMSQGWARALIDVAVPYGTDLAAACDLIDDVAKEVTHSAKFKPEVLDEPEVWGVQELGADGISIRLVIKTRPGEQWAIMRELRLRLHERFEAEGLSMPFTQRTVWLRTPDDASEVKVESEDPSDG